ncbi:hypothetical protein BsIDN1_06360 [Bacillus safensis]|uniref:Hydantoinase B/oxoprolinase domain-containing protein n=1 Tax=Bacillus safensis TaxID=561879 RepID=A0A5S9M2U3_BACIA|nr:hypothetical protein BsIDN1_06360 [Bacillus safensis]
MRTDPAKLEMMRSYFNAIASGMGHVIERTSFTTFVKESADFATALATPSGDFFVYPKTVGVTIFLGLSLKKKRLKKAGRCSQETLSSLMILIRQTVWRLTFQMSISLSRFL